MKSESSGDDARGNVWDVSALKTFNPTVLEEALSRGFTPFVSSGKGVPAVEEMSAMSIRTGNIISSRELYGTDCTGHPENLYLQANQQVWKYSIGKGKGQGAGLKNSNIGDGMG